MKKTILPVMFLLIISNCYSQLDTSHRVPGLTQYWDYVTNGNNLSKLWVLGDTVLIACDYTDSMNSAKCNSQKNVLSIFIQQWNDMGTRTYRN
jgi:hypothetical protein